MESGTIVGCLKAEGDPAERGEALYELDRLAAAGMAARTMSATRLATIREPMVFRCSWMP